MLSITRAMAVAVTMAEDLGVTTESEVMPEPREVWEMARMRLLEAMV